MHKINIFSLVTAAIISITLCIENEEPSTNNFKPSSLETISNFLAGGAWFQDTTNTTKEETNPALQLASSDFHERKLHKFQNKKVISPTESSKLFDGFIRQKPNETNTLISTFNQHSGKDQSLIIKNSFNLFDKPTNRQKLAKWIIQPNEFAKEVSDIPKLLRDDRELIPQSFFGSTSELTKSVSSSLSRDYETQEFGHNPVVEFFQRAATKSPVDTKKAPGNLKSNRMGGYVRKGILVGSKLGYVPPKLRETEYRTQSFSRNKN